jgi:hypothetical protein
MSITLSGFKCNDAQLLVSAVGGRVPLSVSVRGITGNMLVSGSLDEDLIPPPVAIDCGD